MPQRCDDCCEDCCFCCCLVVAILIPVLLLALIALKLYLLLLISYYPYAPEVAVTNAYLTQFDFSADANNTLHYNLALNFTIRNPNKRAGINYRIIQAIGTYRDKKFALVTLSSATPFYQDHKNTTIMRALLLQGQQQWVGFKTDDVSKFRSETAARVYGIDVTFYFWLRYDHVKLFKKFKDRTVISCKLRVPLSSFNETSAGGFISKCTNIRRHNRYVHR